MKEMKEFKEKISVKNELNKKNRKKLLAEKLINGETDVYKLNYEEVEEMMVYFDTYIKEKKRELYQIKKHIIKMRKQLSE